MSANQIFVNLPVENLEKSVEFFTRLGFTFNPQFTDENGTCMIINDNTFAMLLAKKFFGNFTKKEISNAHHSTEVLLALDVGSREKVDHLMSEGITAGGLEHRDTQDMGWMYSRALEDLDGHIWEIFHMDAQNMPMKEVQEVKNTSQEVMETKE